MDGEGEEMRGERAKEKQGFRHGSVSIALKLEFQKELEIGSDDRLAGSREFQEFHETRGSGEL